MGLPAVEPQRSFQFLNYRGMDDLELALQRIAMQLPPSICQVVGIPRSGLLAATMLALNLNVPVTDVAGFLDGRVLATGRRPPRGGAAAQGPTALVVDDSVASGRQIATTRQEIAASGRLDEVLFAVPFVSASMTDKVDLYGEIVEPPRAFAWNILHHAPLLARACLDIDGVLCFDPDSETNDDGPRYRHFLANAQTLFLPSARVRAVVTSRLERYRQETEAWLAENGIEYEELVMLDLPDAATRRAQNAHAPHKARYYAQSETDLFIESDYGQAVTIAQRSGRQVFAIDRREMVFPSPLAATIHAPSAMLAAHRREPPVQALEHRYQAARGQLKELKQTGLSKVGHRLRRLRRS